jgi:prepilin-type N-terminal cleavage/methylation domain-containing protein
LPRNAKNLTFQRGQRNGFTLIEMMVAIAILLVVAGTIIASMTHMMHAGSTVANRTEMHSAVRNVTEMLQQEIGQAGKIGLPTPPGTIIPTADILTTAIVSGTGTTFGVGPNYWSNYFAGEYVTVDSGTLQEIIQLSPTAGEPTSSTLTNKATFDYNHTANSPVMVQGAFANGVIPEQGRYVNGSTTGIGSANGYSNGYRLIFFGDLYDDGVTRLVRYTCSPADPNATGGTLIRDVYTVTNAAVTPESSQTLLDNLVKTTNASGNQVPCFTYYYPKTDPIAVDITGNQDSFVINVALTLSVQTQNRDSKTRQYHTETKALLNVSPRNVFEAWKAASLKLYNRAQPTPSSITTFLSGL